MFILTKSERWPFYLGMKLSFFEEGKNITYLTGYPVSDLISGPILNYFSRAQTTLIDHMKSVHQLNPGFPCTQCDYATTNKGEFVQHMKEWTFRNTRPDIPNRSPSIFPPNLL